MSDALAEFWAVWSSYLIALAVGVAIAFAITVIAHIPFRFLARRFGWDRDALGKVRRRFRIVLIVVAFYVADVAFLPAVVDDLTSARLEHLHRIVLIASSGWLLAAVVAFFFRLAVARFPVDVEDNRVARRVQTQVLILRRLSNVVIGVVTLGAILLTFEGVQAVGASLLASAGLASVIAGLAAQSVLANLFAGLQLAFSDAIRVDDVVIANGEWGRIEEITLTYVVLHTWDDRRIVLPSTYFTTTPFQNWTRSGSALIGAVELDLDWRVSPSAMRERLDEFLAGQKLWDGRTKALQITDATNGWVRVRILVSAANSGALWDLRCNVREAMVEWVHEEGPSGIPRQRVQMVEAEKRPGRRRGRAADEEHEGVFSGSAEAEKRAETYTKSMPIVRPTTAQLEVPKGPRAADAPASSGTDSGAGARTVDADD
ncbi:MAG: mechanosensitive ion channel family protein [Actinomycetales bacterium]|nr:mechanosensitive ion channel family protein [Actinomycetales bacterium]